MTTDTTPKIEARENGPLMLRGVSRMTGADGKDMPCKPVMALCRCGLSDKKPFCDGSHSQGFDDAKGTPDGPDRLLSYEGTEATVLYNPALCSHAAECVRLAGHVFDPSAKPWVAPDKGSYDELADVVAACPSGALSFKGNDGAPDHRVTTARAEVTVEPNGPYWVQGVTPPEQPSSDGQTPNKYVLCRCGHSGNKPFCDGSHRAAGWKSGD